MSVGLRSGVEKKRAGASQNWHFEVERARKGSRTSSLRLESTYFQPSKIPAIGGLPDFTLVG